MRSLAYFEKIKAIKPIPGADKIECAEILGWEVVVKKGEFKEGDLCVYIEIDSILPQISQFEFLRSRKFLVKTIKLKSQISQGIAFPPSIVKEIDPNFDLTSIKVGQDLTDVLNITKYDPEADLDIQDLDDSTKKSWFRNKFNYYKWKLFGFKKVKKGNFPSDVPKTDEVRVQNMSRHLYAKESSSAYITEKLEGTSVTFLYRKSGNWLSELFNQNGIFQVCSRNRIVFNSQNDSISNHHLVTIAEKYNLNKKMRKLNRNIAIQGECIGPKIQDNIYKLPDLEFRAFLVFDLNKQSYLPLQEMLSLLEELDLPFVPMIEDPHLLHNDVKFYVELSKGKSKINPQIDREGIVIRSLNENFSFKSINPDYLLKQ